MARMTTRLVIFLGLLMLGSSLGLAQKPELVVQAGHAAGVNSVAIAPDGKILASGSDDNTIKLWDVASGRELRSLPGHFNGTLSVTFDPTGKTLASGGWDDDVRLWDVTTGRELRTLKGHSQGVASVVFSADGKLLASGSYDRSIKLWEPGTGRELRSLIGHTNIVQSVALSADGKTLASGGVDSTIKLWDTTTGQERRTLIGHSEWVKAVTFNANGDLLATASEDGTIKLWGVATGRLIRTLTGHSRAVESVAFLADGRTLASSSDDRTIKLWDVATGRELRTLTGHSAQVFSIATTPDGAILASGSYDKTIKLWNPATGQSLRTLQGLAPRVTSVACSTDGKTLGTGTSDGPIKIWNAATGRELRTLHGHADEVRALAFSADGKILASGSYDKSVRLWDVSTGQGLRTLQGHSDRIESVAFSTDGKTLASGSADHTVRLWNVATGAELRKLVGHSESVLSVKFAFDGKTLVSGGYDNVIKLWDVATGTELRTLRGHRAPVISVALTHDGHRLASGSGDQTIKLWDTQDGQELRTLRGHTDSVFSLAFSNDGKTLASGGWDQTVRVWDPVTGQELRTLRGHSTHVLSIAFTPNDKFLLSGSEDATARLWRPDSGELVATLIALGTADWAAVMPDGRFDASTNALKLMHWRVGSELIDLDQLKERYYEPGLLAKLMGFSKEPLRDVSKFDNPKLFPDVKYGPPPKGSSNLLVTLTNRGGGIGRVQIFVNGKEFLADARDEKLRANPHVPSAVLDVDLSKATGTVTGKQNEVRVVAWNSENYVSSRGASLVWTAGGTADTAAPEVYAIIGGISDYASSQLNLNFAAKDAVDMANAIGLGATRLFGADKVHLTLLSTMEDPRALTPTKDNFRKAFAAARKAKPTDILIVYLAGHGITLQRGADTYCYLTQEARTTDTTVLSDSAVRQQTTISSEELVDWIKQIPALKQVVMLDTCAAGAAQAQLKLVEKREASGDAIRAIDRAKDRTGSYILMGSAADAVSYEASQYGQGLLTYALLKGIKGAALRNDEFVDVSNLFQFARDEVEQLARNVGGIQKPIVFAPKNDSFEVGQLKSEDKLKIALAVPRPMILRPRFLDADTDDDTLNLMKVLRARLRDESFVSGRGSIGAAIVFVDDEEFPGGIRPTGRYTVVGNNVTVTLRLRRDGVEIGNAQVTGMKDDVPGLAVKMVDAVKEAIKKLPPG